MMRTTATVATHHLPSHPAMVERSGALHTNRPEEEPAREALEEALFDDTRSGQGFCLTALFGTFFWAIIFWVTIWR